MSYEPEQRTRTGVLGWALTGAGAAMVPWMYVLATRLPSTTEVSNWSTAWVGLDTMLAAGLVSTGVLLRRKDSRHTLTAAATAALLVMDAWFDVTTSAGGAERATAVGLAAGVELPLAALCAALAVRGLRSPHQSSPHQSSQHHSGPHQSSLHQGAPHQRWQSAKALPRKKKASAALVGRNVIRSGEIS